MSSRVAYCSAALLAILIAIFATSAGAQTETLTEAGNQVISLHGFGTLGVARSSTDRAEFVRDLSHPSGLTKQWSGKIDSVLGMQANVRATDKVEAVVQAVSRYHNGGNFDPELTWAFVKFDPNANLSLRGGRLGTEFYMLADSRLVGYSYLPIRPPTDYYGALPFSSWQLPGCKSASLPLKHCSHISLPSNENILRILSSSLWQRIWIRFP